MSTTSRAGVSLFGARQVLWPWPLADQASAGRLKPLCECCYFVAADRSDSIPGLAGGLQLGDRGLPAFLGGLLAPNCVGSEGVAKLGHHVGRALGPLR